MISRYGVATLLVGLACTPIHRRVEPREASEEPAMSEVAPMMGALPTAIATPRRALEDRLELDARRRARGREYLARTEWGEPRPGDPMFACQRDDDCTIVELDTCDEINGGWILSVRTDRVHEARYRWQTTDTSQQCTALGTRTEAYPRCGAGTCMRGYRPKAHARRVREALNPRGGRPHPFRTMVPNHVPPQ